MKVRVYLVAVYMMLALVMFAVGGCVRNPYVECQHDNTYGSYETCLHAVEYRNNMYRDNFRALNGFGQQLQRAGSAWDAPSYNRNYFLGH